jgi:hypothetical protein
MTARMNAYRIETPVVFMAFNRPNVTAAVFERIAAAKPGRLLLIADGPREHVAGEADKCREVRAIMQRVDWPCEISSNFSATNLGCRNRIASGLDWVFAQEERAIILEDDCVPAPTFFRYCDELLEKYRDEPRVMTVCGSNWLGETPSEHSYLFTTHMSIWGWATWRRAWRSFDVDLKSWPRKKLESPFERLLSRKEASALTRTLDNLADANPENRTLNTWDFQWFYNCYVHGGLAITPAANMVSNVGFGAEATHTSLLASKLANLPARDMQFPLKHPPAIERSNVFEETYYRTMIRKSFPERARNFVRRVRKRLRKTDGARSNPAPAH